MCNTTKRLLTRNNAAPVSALQYYAQGVPLKQLCKTLGRTPRTVTDWLNGTKVIPPWAIAVLRLQMLEHEIRLDQMGVKRPARPTPPIDHRTAPAANDDAYQNLISIDCSQTDIPPKNALPIFPCMPNPQHMDRSFRNLVAYLVATNQKTPNLTLAKLIHPFAQARLLYKPKGCSSKRLNRPSSSGTISKRQKIIQPRQIRPRGRSPFQLHQRGPG